MGKNTWLSIPNKPLKNRLNCIISKTIYYTYPNEHSNFFAFKTLQDCIKCLKQNEFIENVFIIGGSQLYECALDMNIIHSVYVTRIYNSLGNKYFKKKFFSPNLLMENSVANITLSNLGYSTMKTNK